MDYYPSARKISSPNFDDRPANMDISLLVIHSISLPPGQFGTGCVQDFFQNRLDVSAHPYFEGIANLRVSAHCLIERGGEITQFVPFNKRAWHAGVSSFQGRSNCNDFSIGIELEGTDDTPYTDMQYSVLVELSKYLLVNYPGITLDGIVGHSDIAPGRKTDPGAAFNWPQFKSRLAL